MSKFHEEYHPLLQEEESHICTSPKFQRRFHCGSSGRARAQAKGAAYIITHWPDHLSKLLAYWWIGLGMIALLIFIIYNSILAIAIIPTAPLKSLNILNRHFNLQNISHDKFPECNVYMHVLVNNYEEIIFNDYLPYIETFSKKYTNFTYKFVVLINDTSKYNIDDYSDEVKNELALESLWGETHSDRQMHKKTTVQVISLSKYMDESPLKKYWRDLPREFIGFLSRCIAIWNKGGIALNPVILTPKSPNPIYIEKLEEILGASVNMNISNSHKTIFKKPRRKVNNIQDIINNLQNEDNIDNFEANIVEAENKQKSYVEKNSHKYKSKRNTKLEPTKDNLISTRKYINQEKKVQDLVNFKNAGELHHVPNNKNYHKNLNATTTVPGYNDVKDEQNLLPMFLKFLFNRNSNENSNNSLGVDKNVTENLGFSAQKKWITIPENYNVKIPENNFTETPFTQNFIKENNFQKTIKRNAATLSIDLNGNLIASATPCHAFIGTVFSNVFHHAGDSSSIKDFIITELSLFCKGTLSSCTGIDVILL